MEKIGQMNDRAILYTIVRSNANWENELPNCNWLALTYANSDDRTILEGVVEKCLDYHVSYTCSACELSSLTDDLFDEVIVDRELLLVESQTSEEQLNYNKQLLMTTWHDDIVNAFWFANYDSKTHEENNTTIDAIICIDLSTSNIKDELIVLIERFNNGWVPPD